MTDIDKQVEDLKKMGNDLLSSLKNKDGSWKVEKYQAHEKELCNEQKKLIDYHVISCKICAKSMQEYKENHGIVTTPICSLFQKALVKHIQNCSICNMANKKWNEDSIPITDSMRKLGPVLGRFFKK